MQLAKYLESGPLMWMMHLHVNQKSDYDYSPEISNYGATGDAEMVLKKSGESDSLKSWSSSWAD